MISSLYMQVSAIWVQDKNQVTEAQYHEFYRFVSNAFDLPKYTLHFQADAPIDLKALLFVPSFHTEKFGMGRTEMGVNLYSRKILIESKPADLLPDWLRFLKGVVDSEDLPLSLSREKPQDSSLIRRIREAITRKMLRFLESEMKNNFDKYKEFYTEFNFFLKEGICHDFAFQQQIAKLLMFESSREEGQLTTLSEYISRMGIEEKNIYYLMAPSRKAALSSPYYETFKRHDKEVLFLYNTIDDFVMANLKTFDGRALTSAETSAVDLKDTKTDEENTLSKEDKEVFCSWLKDRLGAKVRDVKTTDRLSDSPAIVTDHQSGALRRMMSMVDMSGSGKSSDVSPQTLEINLGHPIIQGLLEVSKVAAADPMAELVALQVLDNALIAAGLVDDARLMLPRINEILAATLRSIK
jgi:TNF receptor-associated protein 1